MTSRSAAQAPNTHPQLLVIGLNWAMELVVWAIIVISPWLVGGYLPQHLFLFSIGLCILLLLWALKQLFTWRLTLYSCWVSFLLVALFISSGLGLISFPRSTLRSFSPATAQLYDDLLPVRRETSMEGPVDEQLPFSPGTTLSLHPAATQNELLELLALFILFFVTRHAIASPQSLKRLAFVLICNGCLLSIFGLVQKVRLPATQVYGIHIEGAEVFGPFINRNHFASYVNFSICLGIGLFLGSMDKVRRESIRYKPNAQSMDFSDQYHLGSMLDILQHPLAVWLLAPVAVCITAVATSLSRGGILSLFVGLAIILFSMRRRGVANLLPLLLIFALAAGLLIWYGVEPTLERFDQERLATEGRFNIWRAGWDLSCRFPLFGTGLGTFFIVEPLARPINANQTIVHLHAHNEYLEALVEGGIIRLLITLGLVGFVMWYGWRAVGRGESFSEQALAAGAWGGCVALAVQSIGEFGIHLPSVASVAAVVSAHLTALGSAQKSEAGKLLPGPLIRTNFWGLGPLLGVVLAISLAMPLFTGMWRFSGSEINRMTGLELADKAKTTDEYQRALKYFDEAIRFAPGHQRLRLERYETQQELSRLRIASDRDRFETTLIPMTIARLGLASERLSSPVLAGLTDSVLTPFMEQFVQAQILRDERRQSWPEQQRHLLASRDNGPLAWRAHLAISQLVLPEKAQVPIEDRFQYWRQSDDLATYLGRVKMLNPHRAETWFLCGQQEGFNGEREETIRSWRHALELSDEFLEPIIRQSTLAFLQPDLKLTTQDLIEKLIPPNHPNQLVKTAWLLYPKVTETNQRRPFMEAALDLLEQNEKFLEPENQYYFGLALWGVSKREQALQHLLDALRRNPRHYQWRLDLARLQFELRKFSDAHDQLLIVLNADPNNKEAIELREKIDLILRPKPNE